MEEERANALEVATQAYEEREASTSQEVIKALFLDFIIFELLERLIK
ncbi:hypothetical protein GOV10_06915 [Candidatus Woesearchaeota archaeon]|nr:hypothetical protein [Candidatus Woesearchaeota archaeon]